MKRNLRTHSRPVVISNRLQNIVYLLFVVFLCPSALEDVIVLGAVSVLPAGAWLRQYQTLWQPHPHQSQQTFLCW